jgi:hypothetical protein
MEVEILDIKREGEATCFLCKVDLYDYVKHIPKSYQDFAVQRGIVNNQYLDSLSDTVAKKMHIPPIVLITDDSNDIEKNKKVSNFRVLDGLQRTHRLKVISDTLSLILENKCDENIIQNTNKFSRQNSKLIKEIGSSNKLLKKLIAHGGHKLAEVKDFFAGNTIWLEVWSNLTEEAQIRKMLLLNAGHKAVNIKHQLELLFLSTLVKLEEILPTDVVLVREKQVSAITYSKSRQTGHYHFSHIISSLVALSAGKLVNTNTDFISEIQSGSLTDIELVTNFDIELLKNVIGLLYALDVQLFNTFGDRGTKWLGREVVLVGLFGAIGNYSKEKELELHDFLLKLKSNINLLAKFLNIENFEEQRNNVKLNKVNVGNVNRRAVYAATLEYLNDETKPIANWLTYFGGHKS